VVECIRLVEVSLATDSVSWAHFRFLVAQRPGDRTVQSDSGQRDLGRYRTLRCLFGHLERQSFLMYDWLAHAFEPLQTM
jgi:hypothetical protein